jgi:hypothetical protein
MKILIQGLENSQIENLSIQEDYLAITSIKLLMKYLKSEEGKRITTLELIDVNLCITDVNYILRNINSTSINTLDLSYNNLEYELSTAISQKRFKNLKCIKVKGMSDFSKRLFDISVRFTSKNKGVLDNDLVIIL